MRTTFPPVLLSQPLFSGSQDGTGKDKPVKLGLLYQLPSGRDKRSLQTIRKETQEATRLKAIQFVQPGVLDESVTMESDSSATLRKLLPLLYTEMRRQNTSHWLDILPSATVEVKKPVISVKDSLPLKSLIQIFRETGDMATSSKQNPIIRMLLPLETLKEIDEAEAGSALPPRSLVSSAMTSLLDNLIASFSDGSTDNTYGKMKAKILETKETLTEETQSFKKLIANVSQRGDFGLLESNPTAISLQALIKNLNANMEHLDSILLSIDQEVVEKITDKGTVSQHLKSIRAFYGPKTNINADFAKTEYADSLLYLNPKGGLSFTYIGKKVAETLLKPDEKLSADAQAFLDSKILDEPAFPLSGHSSSNGELFKTVHEEIASHNMSNGEKVNRLFKRTKLSPYINGQVSIADLETRVPTAFSEDSKTNPVMRMLLPLAELITEQEKAKKPALNFEDFQNDILPFPTMALPPDLEPKAITDGTLPSPHKNTPSTTRSGLSLLYQNPKDHSIGLTLLGMEVIDYLRR